jgi:hypothetical protein
MTDAGGAAGGGGLPADPVNSIQFNSAGAFGGVAGSAVSASGSVTLAGGSIAVSDPILNLSQTWDDGGNWTTDFVAINLNVTQVSSFDAARLLDFQLDGTSKFTVYKSGNLVIAFFSSVTCDFWYETEGSNSIGLRDGITLNPGTSNLVIQRNGVNPQVFRIYNTYDAVNNESGVLDWVTTANTLVTTFEKFIVAACLPEVKEIEWQQKLEARRSIAYTQTLQTF